MGLNNVRSKLLPFGIVLCGYINDNYFTLSPKKRKKEKDARPGRAHLWVGPEGAFGNEVVEMNRRKLFRHIEKVRERYKSVNKK